MTPSDRLLRASLISVLPLGIAACEIGGKDSQQTGYRGTGGVQITDPDNYVPDDDVPAVPYEIENDTSPPAGQTYENIQVLGDLSTDEFNRLMIAITEWVSPEGGCNYCHNPENMASDEVYTKTIARQMLLMTRKINTDWSSHVQETGVTCYTCHRGEPVPSAIWSSAVADGRPMSILNNRSGQNTPDASVGYSSLPLDAFDSYLNDSATEISVVGTTAYPDDEAHATIKDAEGSYGLMMHLSSALGVNCTYCHNAQSFQAWSLSRQQRSNAFYGIRMVRDVNDGYITPLTPVFPDERLGPGGDPYKVNCVTCHRGNAKPLGGALMLADYPELARGMSASMSQSMIEDWDRVMPAPATSPDGGTAEGMEGDDDAPPE